MQKPNFTNNKIIEQILRVNHAGEYGAKRIYTGQLDKIVSRKDYELIKHMYEQEQVHLSYFEQKLRKGGVRPTILMPFWHGFGYFLGAFTAKLGIKTAMICTEAVEEVIDKHYEDQKKFLEKHESEKELYDAICKFQNEELEHKNIASKHISNLTIKDKILEKSIKIICKIAIFLSKKI